MRTVILAGAVCALVAAGVAIWLGTRGGDADAPPAVGSAATAPHAPTAPPEPGHAPAAVTPLPTPRADTPAGSDDTTYKVDGVTVHDHRGSSAGPPMDLPPNMHPPGNIGRKIQPTLTAALASQLRTVLADCVRSLPAEARGQKPRMDGEIVIGIKGGHASVTRSVIQLRDVTGDVEAVRSCIEQKAAGLGADAPGEADLDGYSLRVSFPILAS